MANLYKISQDENRGYDTYSDAVVAANSLDEAKTIHPMRSNEYYDELSDTEIWNNETGVRWNSWASAPDKVKAELIGIAVSWIEPGTVVCASFHAG